MSHALQFLILVMAGWVNLQQQEVIEYVKEENRVLRELLGGRRPRLTDDQRRRLAAKGKGLGRKVLSDVAAIVTPDTILRWYRVLDRDPLYTAAFRRMLKDSGVNVVRLPSRSPNLNAYAERFVPSIKSECLNRMVLLGERHLRMAASEYLRHYHAERHHQGLGGSLISADETAGATTGCVASRERLGGMLNYYYRKAA